MAEDTVEGNAQVLDHGAFRDILGDMTSSVAAARESVKKLSAQMDTDTKDGISLLSLKHHLMLSYCQGLVLLSTHRILGHSLNPSSENDSLKPFGAPDRGTRGSEPSDLVNSLVEKRVVLEKVKALESKMRYQIDKLVRRAAEPDEDATKNVIDDPLAFRPNPQNLMNQHGGSDSNSDSDAASDSDSSEKPRKGVYRPPKLVPMPYTGETTTSKSKKDRQRTLTPNALAQLRSGVDPYAETTSGLGGVPALQSARAKELARMTEFEEENMTRLVMRKKEAKKRQRDEEDIALGGTGANLASGARGRGRRGVGLEDEFVDVLRSVGSGEGRRKRDGYEELRERSRKKDALERAKARMRDGGVDERERGPRAKKGRFEKDQLAMKRIAKRKANAGR